MSIQSAINIANSTNYLNKEILYLKNVQITEWDIHSAGLSVLKYKKLLPEDQLNELSNLDKHSRTVREGLLQREYPEIAKEIVQTLKEAVQGFIILNNIDDSNILSIKKDAIFLINKLDINQNIVKDYFEFRKKNLYTSYLYLGKIELYYNSMNNTLDIKGISKENIESCNTFYNDLKSLLKTCELNSHDVIFNTLKSYSKRYLERKLPIESYRELKSGMFRLGDYLLSDIGTDDIDNIDISQNYLNFIIPLINQVL